MDLISSLEPFMLSTKNMRLFQLTQSSFVEEKEEEETEEKNKTEDKKEDKEDKKEEDKKDKDEKKNEITVCTPAQKDSLFWCLYILKHGFDEYKNVQNYFVVETTEKFKYIAWLKKQEGSHCYSHSHLVSLEHDLAFGPVISLDTFFVLCKLEQLSVGCMDKRKLIVDSTKDTNDENHIQHLVIVSNVDNKGNSKNKDKGNSKDKTTQYSVVLDDPTQSVISHCLNTLIVVSLKQNKLKSVHSYKKQELIDMCCKWFNVAPETFQTHTKPTLYDMLQQEWGIDD